MYLGMQPQCAPVRHAVGAHAAVILQGLLLPQEKLVVWVHAGHAEDDSFMSPPGAVLDAFSFQVLPKSD